VGPRAGLDRSGKSRPQRDSIPGPSAGSQSHSSYSPTFMSWYFIKHRTTFTLHKIQKTANGEEKKEGKYLRGALVIVSL